MLSCGARKNQIYLVINVAELVPCSEDTIKRAPWKYNASNTCPDSGYIFYNSEIVLDRNGTLIARYRKQNLFMEDNFTPGPQIDEEAIFVTDFNVRFSLQVCFDLIYEHPGYSNAINYGIKDFLMSTAWVDYLPFYIANVAQYGWSRSLNVNLMVSGYHKPEKGKMGSGIYREYMKQPPVYTYNKNSGNVMIISKVKTIPASDTKHGKNSQEIYMSQSVKFTEQEGKLSYFEKDRDFHDSRSTIQQNQNVKSTNLKYNKQIYHNSKAMIQKVPKYLDLKNNKEIRNYQRVSPQMTSNATSLSIPNLSYYNELGRFHLFIHENLRHYKRVILPPSETNEINSRMACHKAICCSISYKYSGHSTYMLIVLDGYTAAPFNRYSLRLKTCGVLWCRTKNYRTCAMVELRNRKTDYFGPFDLNFYMDSDDIVFHAGTHRNQSLVNGTLLKYSKINKNPTLSVDKPIENMLSVQFNARIFDEDKTN